jgi:23S rRNA (guanosine2251-2'-O)-methyltransferase
VVAVTNLSRCLKDLQKLGVWIYGLAGEMGPACMRLI